MFLSLEKPDSDKGVSIFARNLSGEENFDPRTSLCEFDSDRFRADSAIGLANESLGKSSRQKAFGSLFHQFSWSGTTGWEYWSRDYALMLKHALLVAAVLSVPLHVHINSMNVLIQGLEAGLEFTCRPSTSEDVEPIQNDEFSYFVEQIAQGRFYVLTNVVFPDDMPPLPQLPAF